MAGGLVLDSGALIAAERGSEDAWAFLKTAYKVRGVAPLVPSPVVAQYWRTGAGRQAMGARALQQCRIVALDAHMAMRVGQLLSAVAANDIVDASVALLAHESESDVLTSDPDDITKLLDAIPSRVEVHRV